MRRLRLVFAAVWDLWRHPWRLLATVGGVAAVVYLCGLFVLVGTGLDAVFTRDQGRVRFQVYWKAAADPALIARQMDWMRALPGLVEARSFTPQAALAVMGQALGRDADLSLLGGQNPLPYTMLLAFRLPDGDAGFARDMQMHHAQAVDMAMTIYAETDDDELRALAYDIATGQSSQRGEMLGEKAVHAPLPFGGSRPRSRRSTRDERCATHCGSCVAMISVTPT